jgi:carbon-monoxide dehydrogenase large subunit
MDYAVPHSHDMPPVSILTRATPSPMNALGAKGVGEAGPVAGPAALANAVADALRPLGAPAIDMPFTSAKIWHALQRSTKV